MAVPSGDGEYEATKLHKPKVGREASVVALLGSSGEAVE